MSASSPDRDLHEALTGHLSWLRGLAQHLVRDEDEASELVQDTLVAALRRPPHLDRPLAPWLGSVLRRLHFERRRGRVRRARREERAAKPESLPGSDEIVERLELAEQLIAMMRALPEPYRSALALRYRDGLEPKEIAERLGVPGGTVRWRLKEGLDRLRRQLDEERGSRGAWVALLVPLSRVEAPVALPSYAAPAPASIAVALASVVTIVVALVLVSESSSNPPVVEPELASEAPVSPEPAALDETPAIAQSSHDSSSEGATREPVIARSDADSAASGAPEPLLDSADASAPPIDRRLNGRVVDPDGWPPRDSIEITVVSALPYPIAAESPSVGGRSVLARTWTDRNGSFELNGLPESPVQVRARSQAGLSIISGPIRAHTTENDVPRPDLLLQLASESDELEFAQSRTNSPDQPRLDFILIRGQVWRVNESGVREPASAHRVRLRSRYRTNEVALRAGFRMSWLPPDAPGEVTNSDGRFDSMWYVDLSQSELNVEVLDELGTPLGVFPVPLFAGERELEVEFTIEPRASLRVAFTLDPEESLPPKSIGISNGDGRLHTRALDTASARSGEVLFEGLTPGDYEVRWLESGSEVAETLDYETIVFHDRAADARPTQVELAPGEAGRLELDRGALPCLRGRFSVDGERASRWLVEIVPPSAASGAPDTPLLCIPLDELGGLRCRVPRTGRYEVRLASSGDDATYVCAIEVSERGADLDVELFTTTVTGVWTGGTTPDRAWLRTPLSGGGQWIAPVTISPDGTLRIERAAPGLGELVFASHALEVPLAEAIARFEVPRRGRTDLRVP